MKLCGTSVQWVSTLLLVAMLVAVVQAALRDELAQEYLDSRFMPYRSRGHMAALRTHDLAYLHEASTNISIFRSSLMSRVVQGDKANTQWPWDPYPPHISCPPGRSLKRYGSTEDGGKWLCALEQMKAPCVIYSLGSNGQYDFELAMIQSTPCSVHTFDCTYNGTSQHPRHVYHKLCIGNVPRPDYQSLKNVTRNLGHSRLELLKVDIEGWEYVAMSELSELDVHLPQQLSMEVHSGSFGDFQVTPTSLAVFFGHIANLGYGIVSKEDNPIAGSGCCSEFTFLRVQDLVYKP
eukprot:jgi/Chrzof1/6115/Cz17g10100.t1